MSDFHKSGSEMVELELSEADAYRLANGMTRFAQSVLEEDGETASRAALQALQLRQEVLSQIRGEVRD